MSPPCSSGPMFLVSMMNTRILITPLSIVFVCLSGGEIESEWEGRECRDRGIPDWSEAREDMPRKPGTEAPGTSYDRPAERHTNQQEQRRRRRLHEPNQLTPAAVPADLRRPRPAYLPRDRLARKCRPRRGIGSGRGRHLFLGRGRTRLERPAWLLVRLAGTADSGGVRIGACRFTTEPLRGTALRGLL